MQRLVRHAQQGAVGHAEAIALGGDGGAFHVDGDGAALVEAQGRFGIAQLPVPVVGGHDGAGAQAQLDLVARHAADRLGGVVQGALDLGDRGDGDIGRQHRVQHVIVAQIGVGQHIVADGLAGAQAAAVTDHQPDVRTGDGQVVGDGLGVGRPDADVDQGHALMARRGQVIGRHLVLLPGRVADRRLGVGRVARDDHAAGAGQGFVGAARRLELFDGPAHELVDIAVVVGEQDIGLNVVDRRAGVVLQPRQREVGPEAVEVRQGEVPAHLEQTVGDLVADMGQVRGGEPARKGGRHRPVQRDLQPVGHIGEGDFLTRDADLEGRIILLFQQAQLFGQIGTEQVRPGDGGRVAALARQPGIGARLQVLGAISVPADAKFGIGEHPFGAFQRIGPLAGVDEIPHGVAQVGHGLGVKGFEAVQRRLCCHLFCHDFL